MKDGIRFTETNSSDDSKGRTWPFLERKGTIRTDFDCVQAEDHFGETSKGAENEGCGVAQIFSSLSIRQYLVYCFSRTESCAHRRTGQSTYQSQPRKMLLPGFQAISDGSPRFFVKDP